MTAHQQEITVLVAALCLVVALIGLVVMLSAFAFPAISTASRRLFASGVVVAVTASLVYLTYTVSVLFILSERRP